MKPVVQQNHLGGQILGRNPGRPKNGVYKIPIKKITSYHFEINF